MAQLCWIPECCSQANPSHRSCNSWSLQLPSLPTSPTQHILPAARSALGPVQDPAAPAYHTPPERSHLSAGTSPAALHGVTLALCLENWPLSQADNSQHRIKTWCLTWSRAPSAQPHSPRQQEKAPQSKGGLSETRGTAQIWVWAPFWQAGGCDEVCAARNANTSTANTPRDKEYNRAEIYVQNSSSYLDKIFFPDKVYLSSESCSQLGLLRTLHYSWPLTEAAETLTWEVTLPLQRKGSKS